MKAVPSSRRFFVNLIALLAVMTVGIVALPTAAGAVTYCVYDVIFQGTGCPVTVPAGGSTNGTICIVCPPSDECRVFSPTRLLRIRGTLCFVSAGMANNDQTNCSTCPTSLLKYSVATSDEVTSCSVPADDGLDNDGDGLIDEEMCDGLDNDADGRIDEDIYSGWLVDESNVGVGGDPAPSRLQLTIDGPNPAADILRYDLAVPRASLVRVGLYDAAGHRVAIIMQQQLPPGRHPFEWRRSSNISSGMYFLRMEGAGGNLSRKVVFLR